MRHVLAGAVVIAAVLLAGCGTAVTPAVQRGGESVMLAAAERANEGMAAQILGTLTRTAEGCLAVEHEGNTYVLQFPFGSRLADDGESVEIPDVGTLRLGDAIEGGGGYIDLPDAPAECRISAEFAVWQTVPD